MKIKLIILLISFCFFGCKTNQIINEKREGKWKFRSVLNDTLYFQKGTYKNDLETGTWKSYENKKLYRKEKYKERICYVTNYYPNGKIKSKGTSKLEKTGNNLNWVLSGDWDYYNEKGKHYLTRTYLNGYQITEKEID